MFFDYCIILHQNSDDFWRAKPSQIKYCREKYAEILKRQQSQQEVEEIQSMHDIPGWGCHG